MTFSKKSWTILSALKHGTTTCKKKKKKRKGCTTMTNCQFHWEHHHETVLTSTDIAQSAGTLITKHCTSTFDHKSTALQFLKTWLGMCEYLLHQIVRNVRNIDIQTRQHNKYILKNVRIPYLEQLHTCIYREVFIQNKSEVLMPTSTIFTDLVH